jgi:hypothetical protein
VTDDAQRALDALVRQLKATRAEPVPDLAATNGRPRTAMAATVDDERILEKCYAAKNAPKFVALYDHGDVHTYHGGDDSVADLALLTIMRFWTQDAAQLEEIFSTSALGQREKWTRRANYRRVTIAKAIEGDFEIYDWSNESGRPLLSSSSVSPGVSSDDDNNETPKAVWFSELGEPKERKYLIEQIGVKGYPIVAFGAGGVAKSYVMLAAGVAIASASGVDEWLGLRILEHGYVLYLDFELDVEEQHRRVRDLCAGMGIPYPTRLGYLSGVGFAPDVVFRTAVQLVKQYKAKAVIIDSMGLAMQGDMEKGRDVLTFYSRNINPLRRAGATPFIVDHEGKLQSGEKHKDKSPFGSAYKAWASRSVLQFEHDTYDKESSALEIRVRQTKTNFGPKLEPIGVRLTFAEKKVSVETFELPDLETMEEESKPVKERVAAGLELGPATNADLQRLTGASPGTIRNNLSQLIQEGVVREDGYNGRSKVYALSSSSDTPKDPGDDDNHKSDAERVQRLVAEGVAEDVAKALVAGAVPEFFE